MNHTSCGLHRKGGRAEGFWVLGREPSQAISQDSSVEIDEQTNGYSREPQIANDLCFVNWEQSLDGFQLQ